MKCGLLVLMFAFKSVTAQFYFYDDHYLDRPVLIDVGLHFGMMNCLTDLGHGNKNRKSLEWSSLDGHPEIGASLGVRWHQKFGIRFQLTHGIVTASDSVLKDSGGDAIYRYQRNLHFRSRIFEASLLAIVYPAGFFSFENPPKSVPYLFVGLGIFHFDPQAFLLGNWTSLAPLRTEGIDPSTFYNLWQSNFITGIGGSYEINGRISTSMEFGYRILHTDYLDDISKTFIDPSTEKRSTEQTEKLNALYAFSRVRQGPDVSKPGSIRGNASNNDSYFSFRVMVSWTINRERIH